MEDSAGNILSPRDRVEWVGDGRGRVGTVQEIICTTNAHGGKVNDIVIDFDDRGRYTYMQKLVYMNLLKVDGVGELNADTPAGIVQPASGK